MIRPRGDRVLIKPDEPDKKSSGGLILAKMEEDNQDQGIVVQVGDGSEVQDLKKGDHIVFQKYGPAKVEIDKIEYVIVMNEEILGVEVK